jgi:glutathione S-transferase
VTVAAFMEKQPHKDNFNAAFIHKREETVRRCLAYFENHIEKLQPLSIASIAVACALGYIGFRLPHLSPGDHCPDLSKWFTEFSQRSSMVQTVPVQ